MSTTTSLLTEAARTAAAQNAEDYTASMAGHVAGDLGQHNQAAIHDVSYTPITLAEGSTSHEVLSARTLRLLVTINGVDYVIAVPAVGGGAFTGGGTDSGAPNAVAPTIVTHPQSVILTRPYPEVYLPFLTTLTVVASGTLPLFYQWTQNNVVVPGATGSTHTVVIVLNPATVDRSRVMIDTLVPLGFGTYRCVVTNSVGQVTSNPAVVSLAGVVHATYISTR